MAVHHHILLQPPTLSQSFNISLSTSTTPYYRTLSRTSSFYKMSALMDLRIPLLLLLAFLSGLTVSGKTESTRLASKITVMGIVYCDICFTNTFSRNSYFLPGVEVHIDCEFKANSPSTSEQFSFSVNRTTDKLGIYKLEIPSVDGVKCAERGTTQLLCQARLIGNSSSSCNVPGLMKTSDQMTIKSKKNNHCVYCLNPLNYKPSKRDPTSCGNHKEEMPNSLGSTMSFTRSTLFPPVCMPAPSNDLLHP